MTTIIKTNCLSPAQYSEIQNLQQKASKIDGFTTHFYWNAMKIRPDDLLCDYLLYKNINNQPQLVACLSIFFFDETEQTVEVCALTHPNHRKQGYFFRLLTETVLELMATPTTSLLFCTPKNATASKNLLKKLNAHYDSSEIKWSLTLGNNKDLPLFNHRIPLSENFKIKKVQLNKENSEDLIQLAQINAACFNTDIADETAFLEKTKEDKNRAAFFIFHRANHKNKNKNYALIGKSGLQNKNEGKLIHDFCLLPEYANMDKLWEASLMGLLQYLCAHCKSSTTFFVEANTNHPKEIKLYKKLGFALSDTLEFWRLPLTHATTALGSSPLPESLALH